MFLFSTKKQLLSKCKPGIEASCLFILTLSTRITLTLQNQSEGFSCAGYFVPGREDRDLEWPGRSSSLSSSTLGPRPGLDPRAAALAWAHKNGSHTGPRPGPVRAPYGTNLGLNCVAPYGPIWGPYGKIPNYCRKVLQYCWKNSCTKLAKIDQIRSRQEMTG